MPSIGPAAVGAATPDTLGARLLARYGRLSTGRPVVAEIDGLRAVAILAVVATHVGALAAAAAPRGAGSLLDLALAGAAGHGGRGVSLFFVISGLLLGSPFAAQHLAGAPAPDLRRFFLRRLTRLEVPYAVAMTGAAVARAVTGMPPAVVIGSLAASLAYLHGAIFGTESALNDVAWSLEVEAQFYVVVPLAAQVFRLRPAALRRAVVGACALAFVLLQWAIPAPPDRLVFSIAWHGAYFALGLLLADMLRGRAQPATGGPGWDAAAALALAAMIAWPEGILARAVIPLAAATLVMAALRGRLWRAALAHPAMGLVGAASYSLYLIHHLVLAAVMRMLPAASAPQGFARAFALLALAAVLPLAACTAAFYLLVERPCMRPDWPRRAWARLSAGPTPLPPAP